MIPTDVTGFVIEAMRNTVPLDIGMPLATSCLPKALRYRIESLFVTAATTPGISPWSTAAWNMRSIAAAPLGLRVGGPADCAVQPRATESPATCNCDAFATSCQTPSLCVFADDIA